MTSNQPLIATKLRPPGARKDLVPRRRLLDLLDAGMQAGCRLILISAPAGYGKTTLAIAWLANLRCSQAWVSLEEAENDPVRFLTYLGTALEKIAPEFNTYVQSLGSAPQLPEAKTVAVELINAMVPTSNPFLLILDDYHVISHQYPHDVIRNLLQYQPANFHLMIVTREDPPFPLNKMRVRNEVREVRMHDLRFTEEEASDFFRAQGLSLPAEAVASCAGKTEGWAAGLQLAALSLKGRSAEEVKTFLAVFGGSHHYIIDYLVDEVLSRQGASTQEFLRRTALLDRLTPSLCDAVTGRRDSGEMLRRIETDNLFLIPLDEKREWFRYHHLFADSMRTQLENPERAEIHRRASKWFECQGDLPEAIKHALAACEMTEAARLIDAAALDMLSQSEREMTTLCDWLESLPDEVLQANGGLFAGKPWALYLTGRHQEAEAFLSGIPMAQRAKMSACDQAHLLSLDALIAFHRGDSVLAADLARRALESIDGNTDPMSRASTVNTLGGALSRLGDMNGAESAFREANELARSFPRAFISAVTASNLSSMLDLRGRRKEAEMTCRRIYQLFLDETGKPSTYGGILALRLGVVAYEANELFDARLLLETGLDLCQAIGYPEVVEGEENLALTLDALGERGSAMEVLQAGRNRHVSEDDLFLITAVEAELERRQGNMPAALDWAERWHLSFKDSPKVRRESGYLTYIRLLLDTEHSEQALDLCSTMLARVGTANRVSRLIPLRVLQALALWTLKRKEQSATAIREAVSLAAKEGYMRAFLEQGPAVAQILLQAEDVAPSFVVGLITAFNKPGTGTLKKHFQFAEPLTQRENELLRLLAEGLTNEEISRKLYISLNTTKWHLKSIFSKLSAENRIKAVRRARELGIIS